jgi:L-2-hydroxyglutarate oxidase LhgO
METVDCLVVGAGVVGLAIACVLARAGREVVILESGSRIGAGISSRSSEVIHAGLYYPTGLLKTRLCVEGKDLLYRFCEDFHVAHRRCGKLLVAATAAEIPKLEALAAQAALNGVGDLVWLSGEQASQLEPELRAERALLSPSTGIIDSDGFLHALLGDAESHGAVLSLETPLVGGVCESGRIVVETGGGAPTRVAAKVLVNAAGLGAQGLAQAIAGMPQDKIPPLHLAKGNYFSLSRRAPFSHLIYPMPSEGGLGVHLTLDLGGQARFGPDVEWIETIDYTVDPSRAEAFYAAIRLYWPGLPDDSLAPAYCGIRPKIERPGGPATDFMIQTSHDHGVAGLINLFGIESPGLTASLAIARHVARSLSR